MIETSGNVSRVVKKLASSVSSAQSIMFHGARIALLGHVTKVMSSLLNEEETERHLLLQQLHSIGVSLVIVPFDPLRVQSNKIEIDEHEERYEIFHEEFALHREMHDSFLSRWEHLTAGIRERQRIERAAIERETVMRLVEIVCCYEAQHKVIAQWKAREKAHALHVSNGRETVRETEVEQRATIASHESLCWKQFAREAATSKAKNREGQILFECQLVERLKMQAEQQAQQEKASADAAEAEQRVKAQAEVDDAELLTRRRIVADEAFLFSDILKTETVKRGLLY